MFEQNNNRKFVRCFTLNVLTYKSQSKLTPLYITWIKYVADYK